MGPNEWLLVLVMLIGLAGTVIPLIPGMGLILLSLVIYRFFVGGETISWLYLIIVGVITIGCFFLDYLAGAMGAKKYGASALGMTGAVVGGIIGMLVFSIIGMLIGAVVGIVAMELYQKKTVEQSLTAATGVVIGNVASAAIQFILALVIIIITVVKLWS